jgi:hypothetical protein
MERHVAIVSCTGLSAPQGWRAVRENEVLGITRLYASQLVIHLHGNAGTGSPASLLRQSMLAIPTARVAHAPTCPSVLAAGRAVSGFPARVLARLQSPDSRVRPSVMSIFREDRRGAGARK